MDRRRGNINDKNDDLHFLLTSFTQEAYLLRTRLHKMPYKHIAAHLKKTELACRLHYHQMSYGHNGRRRSDSISSTGSFTSITAGGELSDNAYHTQLSPVVSPSSSPALSSRRRMSSDSAHRAHVPILPKPDTSCIPLTLEPSTDHVRSQGPDTIQSNSKYHHQREEQGHIDLPRLLSIYNTYRERFWSNIADEYSRGVTEVPAKAVEEAIISNLSQGIVRAHLPPTPNVSPKSSPEPHRHDYSFPVSSTVSRSFHAVNASKPDCVAATTQLESTRRSLADRCSVSALLTEEKEVRLSHQ